MAFPGLFSVEDVVLVFPGCFYNPFGNFHFMNHLPFTYSQRVARTGVSHVSSFKLKIVGLGDNVFLSCFYKKLHSEILIHKNSHIGYHVMFSLSICFIKF